MNAPRHFPVARYRFDFRVERPIRLPDYAGSMLRGAFGHALRHIACMTRAPACAGCTLSSVCAYPALFAPPPPATHSLQRFTQIPAPYIIEPPAWGSRVLATDDTLSFHQVLVGRALDELPLIILAWRRALARGVGAGDGMGELTGVVHCAEDGEGEVHQPPGGSTRPHRQTIDLGQPEGTQPRAATLIFTTPLRLQDNGRALPPARLQARTLLIALARRANLLAEFHAAGVLVSDFRALADACAALTEEKRLVWRDWTRYSARQQQKMALGGVVGTWRLEGDLRPFAALLKLGQWLHVGKEASFGLGGYTLQATCREDISAISGKRCECPRQVVEETDTIP